MRRLGFGALVLASATCLSCGGEDFTPGAGGSGGSGQASTSSSSGEGAQGGVGAASSSTGIAGGSTGGAGGSGGAVVGCAPGEYEDHLTHLCAKCTKLASIAFDPASIQDIALMGAAGEPVFPRVQHVNGKLPMVYTYLSDNYELGKSDDAPWDTGVPLAPLNTDKNESGALLLPVGVDVPGTPQAATDSYVLFDRNASGEPEIYAAIYGGAGTLLPGVVNEGVADLHIAYAYNTNIKRVWWSSNRLVNSVLTFGLFTTGLAGSPTATPVPITLTGSCVNSYPDVAPWVTPDGKLLLFHAKPCDNSSQDLKVWYVGLDTMTGQPSGPATEIADIETAGSDTGFPSFSPDYCRIFYSTTETSGYYHVRSAKRW